MTTKNNHSRVCRWPFCVCHHCVLIRMVFQYSGARTKTWSPVVHWSHSTWSTCSCLGELPVQEALCAYVHVCMSACVLSLRGTWLPVTLCVAKSLWEHGLVSPVSMQVHGRDTSFDLFPFVSGDIWVVPKYILKQF